jgi:hypothetical protein
MVLFQIMLPNNLVEEAEQLFACTSLLHNHRNRKSSHTLRIARDERRYETNIVQSSISFRIIDTGIPAIPEFPTNTGRFSVVIIPWQCF